MLSIARNGAKICKENPRVFTERKIRGKVFQEIYQSLQRKICKANPRVIKKILYFSQREKSAEKYFRKYQSLPHRG
jgi:hypothetical protein